MRVSWLLYCFNNYRYVDLEPQLAQAQNASDLSDYAVTPELKNLLLTIQSGHKPLADAIHPIILAQCCDTRPVELNANISRILVGLARGKHANRSGRKVKEMLEPLFMGSGNNASNISTEGPIKGFLTPEQTVELYNLLEPIVQANDRRKTHWIVRTIQVLRLVADASPDHQATLSTIFETLKYAVSRGQGIAIAASE